MSPSPSPDTGSSRPLPRSSPPPPPHERDAPKKRAKQQLSCAECRRLKLKCDREIPCSNCVRRGCRELCPDGTKETRRPGLDAKSAEQLQKRLSSLEGVLAAHGLEMDDDTNVYRRGSPRRDSMSSMRGGSTNGESWRGAPGHSESPHFSHRRSRSPSRLAHPTSDQHHTPRFLQFSESPVGGPSRDPSFALPPPPSMPQPQPPIAGIPPPQLPPISSFSSGPHGQPGSAVEHSHGTLVLGKSGRSRYLGPTAGTEWLKNQEVGGMESAAQSQSPADAATPHAETPGRNYTDPLYSFPFNEPAGPSTIEALFARLPPRDDAEVLVDSYYRYFAWNHNPAPRRTFQPIFDRVFNAANREHPEQSVHLQQLALVYMILAMGTVHNIELPPHDPTAEEYLALGKGCLTKGDFLNHGTIPGVQALVSGMSEGTALTVQVTMAHYYLETENGRNGDAAWPLWGLGMSLIVAMGLHRDGARWNLPEDVVEERRQVFWECYTIEIFQANCFSRPNSLVAKYIDTAFPSPTPAEVAVGGRGWPRLKFELCQISSRILDAAMTVQFQSYNDVQQLFAQLCDFERNVPFELRCRTALLALPSVYPDPEAARRNSPDVSRHNLHRTLQQFTLALNISENILFLQRPYFVMAMHDQPADPTRSVYGHSYLAVVERCNVIIQVVADLYKLHPTIISRQWFFWYHLFTAAVCLGTLILKNPQTGLANFALSQIEQAITVYSVLIKQNNSPSMVQNHDWLRRLQQRAAKKIAQASGAGIGERQMEGDDQGQEEEDRELLGWKTRLIERAASGVHTAVNITSAGAVINRTPSPMAQQSSGMTPAMHLLQQHFVPPQEPPRVNGMMGSTTLGLDNSTDMLLHQFWDPMMVTDGEGGSIGGNNWWSWDFTMGDDSTQANQQAAPSGSFGGAPTQGIPGVTSSSSGVTGMPTPRGGVSNGRDVLQHRGPLPPG
ncbi:hypothetical protein IAT38_005891 [Cryptococcus sp. DSM 104549]